MNVGILGLLFVLFLGLKLANIIAWAWIWVFAPLWAGLALFSVVAVAYVLLKIFVRR